MSSFPQVVQGKLRGEPEPDESVPWIMYEKILRGYKGQKAEWWVGAWLDHAHRVVRRRLVRTDDGSVVEARYRAVEEREKRKADYYDALADKLSASADEIERRSELANFPREVVEREVRRICKRIAGDADENFDVVGHNNELQPGAKMFAERSGISNREVVRILGDRARISVSIGTVDLICVEFDMLLDDFVDSSFQWADKTGKLWTHRRGDQDPWPFGFGYVDDGLDPSYDDDVVVELEGDDQLPMAA